MNEILITLNNISLVAYVPNTISEYKGGAKLVPPLGNTHSILFDFKTKMPLSFHNTGVNENITVLLIEDMYGKVGAVSDFIHLRAGDKSKVCAGNSWYRYALEVSKDLFDNSLIGIGSILILRDSL
jgi:uncharacterized membrane protein (UPF0127 family)